MTSGQRDWSVAIMALEQEENVRFENLPPRDISTTRLHMD